MMPMRQAGTSRGLAHFFYSFPGEIDSILGLEILVAAIGILDIDFPRKDACGTAGENPQRINACHSQ
jgi:hypothetical protein